MAANIQKITEISNVSEGCVERFLRTGSGSAWALREAGILTAGLSLLLPGYHMGRVRERRHFAVLTAEGGARYRTNRISAGLQPGSLFLAPARSPHEYYVESGMWRAVWFTFSEEAPLWCALPKEPMVRSACYLPDIERSAEGFWAECLRHHPDSEKVARLHAEVLVAYLRRELAGGEDLRMRVARSKFDRLLNVVSQRLEEPWSVHSMAALAGLSPTHLYRMCVQLAGRSPLALVTRLRVQRAEELLLEYDWPLDTVAERVGYASAYAFSRAFLRERGVRPGAFRRMPGREPETSQSAQDPGARGRV